ncbi:L-lactate dehydrogenase [Candidatus Entotheonellaceae bacterium PAL068K]
MTRGALVHLEPGRRVHADQAGPRAYSRTVATQAASATHTTAEAVSLADFEPMARAHLWSMVYAYISGGAADEMTLRWNRESLDRIQLRPHVLVEVSQLDTNRTLFGQPLPFPILLALTAFHRLVHPQGEGDGRRCDPASLPAVAEKVAGRVPLLLDGGIRQGTDVLKALALGPWPLVVHTSMAWVPRVARACDGSSPCGGRNSR